MSQMPQNLSAQIVCPSPKVLDFNEKKASLGAHKIVTFMKGLFYSLWVRKVFHPHYSYFSNTFEVGFFFLVFVIDYNWCVFFLLLLGTNESFLEARNLSPSSRSVGTFNLKNFCTKLCSQLGAYELFCYFWSLPQKMNWWFYHEKTARYVV